jgi:long-chain acyl-CoA synthetase
MRTGTTLGLDEARRLTFAQMLSRRAADEPGRIAVHQQRRGSWRPYTWRELHEQAAAFGSGLLEIGCERGSHLGLLLRPSVEGLIALLGAQGVGVVPFGIFPGTPQETVDFLLETTAARMVIVDKGETATVQAGRASTEVLELGEQFDQLLERGARRRASAPDEWKREVQAGRIEEPSTIYFTSGTTGSPKGVLLSVENLLTAGYFDFFSDPPGLLPAPTPDDRLFHEIPLASVPGPVFGIYYELVFGSQAYIPDAGVDNTAALQHVSPTMYLTFPRMWETRASQATAAMDARPAAIRSAYGTAMAVRQRVIDLQEAGKTVPVPLRWADALADRLFCKPLLKQWGFASLGLVLTGGATLTPELVGTWRRWGVVIRQIYGQTETGGLATIQTERFPRPGNAGRPSPRVQVRVDEDGEILVRGDGGLFLGHLNLPEQTAAVMDESGWLRTGDVGMIDADGNLRMMDRRSDIIVLESGEQVVASQIETVLKQSRFVRNAVVGSDGVDMLYALLELDPDAAAVWGKRQGITADGYEALAADEQVRALVDAEVEAANGRLRLERLASISATRILPRAIDINDPSQVTATRKVRRRQIAEKYQGLVDEMIPVREEPDALDV